MPNPTTPLKLAKSRNEWREMDDVVNDCVRAICGDCDRAEALMLIVDLMTNDRYEPADRENISAEVKHQTFKYVRGYDNLLRDVIEKINPMPRKLSRVS